MSESSPNPVLTAAIIIVLAILEAFVFIAAPPSL